MIAFIHWDEPGGELVEPGEAWVVKADGSEARRVAPKGVLPVRSRVSWSADGSRLLCEVKGELLSIPPVSVDVWARHVRLALDPEGCMEWSPDGGRVACTRTERGHMEGEPGYWRRLLVMDANGSGPRVLVEQFVADAQLDAYRPSEMELEAGPTYDWRDDLLWWAGPITPTWSPRGDKIAFLAALPFDPDQMASRRQVDAWVYDLITRRLTKLTSDPKKQYSLSWR